MQGIKKMMSRIALMGSFALAVFTQTAPAHGHVVLPSTVRAVRTPSKPVKVTPPIGISASGGTLTYLKSRHRDPVIVFEVKLSRAPGKTGVSVAYQTSGNNPTADSLFDNVNGEAIFHGTATKYKIYVPVTGTIGTTPGNFVLLQLSNPADGVITDGEGTYGLVTKAHKR